MCPIITTMHLVSSDFQNWLSHGYIWSSYDLFDIIIRILLQHIDTWLCLFNTDVTIAVNSAIYIMSEGKSLIQRPMVCQIVTMSFNSRTTDMLTIPCLLFCSDSTISLYSYSNNPLVGGILASNYNSLMYGRSIAIFMTGFMETVPNCTLEVTR